MFQKVACYKIIQVGQSASLSDVEEQKREIIQLLIVAKEVGWASRFSTTCVPATPINTT